MSLGVNLLMFLTRVHQNHWKKFLNEFTKFITKIKKTILQAQL